MTRRARPFAAIVDLATHPEAHVAVEQLAAYWNLDVQTVRKWIRLGRLPGYRFGRVLRAKTVDALAFEQRSQVAAFSRGTLPSDTDATGDVRHGVIT